MGKEQKELPEPTVDPVFLPEGDDVSLLEGGGDQVPYLGWDDEDDDDIEGNQNDDWIDELGEFDLPEDSAVGLGEEVERVSEDDLSEAEINAVFAGNVTGFDEKNSPY